MKIIPVTVAILFCYVIGCSYLFCSHYEYHGDPAALCYYAPFDALDYFLVCLMTVAAIVATYYFSFRKLCKRIVPTVLCAAIYATAALWIMIFHVAILEYPTEWWPHDYHPMPIQTYLDIKSSINCL